MQLVGQDMNLQLIVVMGSSHMGKGESKFLKNNNCITGVMDGLTVQMLMTRGTVCLASTPAAVIHSSVAMATAPWKTGRLVIWFSFTVATGGKTVETIQAKLTAFFVIIRRSPMKHLGEPRSAASFLHSFSLQVRRPKRLQRRVR